MDGAGYAMKKITPPPNAIRLPDVTDVEVQLFRELTQQAEGYERRIAELQQELSDAKKKRNRGRPRKLFTKDDIRAEHVTQEMEVKRRRGHPMTLEGAVRIVLANELRRENEAKPPERRITASRLADLVEDKLEGEKTSVNRGRRRRSKK